MVDERAQSGGWSRVDSFGWVALGYVVAVAAWLWCLAGATAPLAALFGAFLASMLVIYVFSIAFDNGSFFDAYWSVIPPLVALFWIGQATDAVTMRQVVATVLVFAWGARLTWNWARGWTGLEHEDWRYVDLYQRSPLPKPVTSLIGIHFFPMLQVFLGCLALMPALAYGARPFGWIDFFAVIVTAGAILIETIADEQMRAFARTKQPGDIMRSGLWAYSRHPNYFGELGFWWGLFLFALAADPGAWWTGVGALAMSLMFHFASVPMLDQRSLERRPDYAEHMRRVNAIIPGRPRN